MAVERQISKGNSWPGTVRVEASLDRFDGRPDSVLSEQTLELV